MEGTREPKIKNKKRKKEKAKANDAHADILGTTNFATGVFPAQSFPRGEETNKK